MESTLFIGNGLNRTLRATLYYRNKNGFQNLIVNNITYFLVVDDTEGKDTSSIDAKCSLLSALHVNVIKKKISSFITKEEKEAKDISERMNEYYKRAYEAIFKDIVKQISIPEEN